MFFITKPVTTGSFIFKEKYQRETLCLTRSIKPVCRKRILRFDKKENYDIEKLLSCI